MKKILLFGASSFVGSNLAVYLRKHYRVYGTYSTTHPRIDGVPCFRLPLTPSSPILEVINIIRPEAVVYCPAYANTLQNAKDSDAALFINAEAPAFLARAMDQRGGRFIYLSTSKVFSGKLGDYAESDPIDPVGLYGMTKARGEELISDVKNTFIFRLGTIFGLGTHARPSLFNRLLSHLLGRKEVPYISDEYRTFYSTADVARAVGIAIDASIEAAGLYHLVQHEKHTYYSFGKLVANLFGISGNLLVPVAGDTFSTNLANSTEPRGHDLSLRSDFFEQTFHFKAPSLEESIVALRQQLETGM